MFFLPHHFEKQTPSNYYKIKPKFSLHFKVALVGTFARLVCKDWRVVLIFSTRAKKQITIFNR